MADAAPSLDDLTVFLAVLRCGGFRAAARPLRLSPSHVSATISRLEAALGVPLLVRTTRRVTPTEAGRTLAARLEPLWSDTRAVLQDLAGAGGEIRGSLKLGVPGAVMVDILPPLVERFLSAHPAIRLEIVVENRLVDLGATGCDAGIRYSEHLAQDMVAVPIGPRRQQIALAAAPAYLASRGTPAEPAELMRHDCIRLRFESGALVDWELERGQQRLTVDPPGRLVVGVDAVAAAIGFARAGFGIIGVFRNWLDADIEAGRLAPVLPEWWAGFDGPFLYFPRGRVAAPLRAFLDIVAAPRRSLDVSAAARSVGPEASPEPARP